MSNYNEEVCSFCNTPIDLTVNSATLNGKHICERCYPLYKDDPSHNGVGFSDEDSLSTMFACALGIICIMIAYLVIQIVFQYPDSSFYSVGTRIEIIAVAIVALLAPFIRIGKFLLLAYGLIRGFLAYQMYQSGASIDDLIVLHFGILVLFVCSIAAMLTVRSVSVD